MKSGIFSGITGGALLVVGLSAMPVLAQSTGDNTAAVGQAAQSAREVAQSARDAARAAARDAERAARNKERAAKDKDKIVKDKEKTAAAHTITGAYQRGTRALDDRDYNQAIEDFRRVIEARAGIADGAAYWEAYAQMKLGMINDAMATLNSTLQQFPQSAWLGDMRALQAELQQSLGKSLAPETEPDEDIKLLALNSLIRTEPDRALPLLQKVLNDPKNSPRLKERALFVLAGSKDLKAREIVMQYAKGGGNPDLQVRAIEYLGMARTPENQQALADIYGSSTDVNVKRAVLRGFLVSRDADRLTNAARSETNPELRKDAIRWLGTIRTDAVAQSLASLYASESDKSIKGEILTSLGLEGAARPLIEIARKETDPELKRRAVQVLSMMKSREATDFMVELLNK